MKKVIFAAVLLGTLFLFGHLSHQAEFQPPYPLQQTAEFQPPYPTIIKA